MLPQAVAQFAFDDSAVRYACPVFVDAFLHNGQVYAMQIAHMLKVTRHWAALGA